MSFRGLVSAGRRLKSPGLRQGTASACLLLGALLYLPLPCSQGGASGWSSCRGRGAAEDVVELPHVQPPHSCPSPSSTEIHCLPIPQSLRGPCSRPKGARPWHPPPRSPWFPPLSRAPSHGFPVTSPRPPISQGRASPGCWVLSPSCRVSPLSGHHLPHLGPSIPFPLACPHPRVPAPPLWSAPPQVPAPPPPHPILAPPPWPGPISPKPHSVSCSSRL